MTNTNPTIDNFSNVCIDDGVQPENIIIDFKLGKVIPYSNENKKIFYKKKSPYNISKKRKLFTRTIKTHPI